jgi:caffeoyl-CoA O-methyltransferase
MRTFAVVLLLGTISGAIAFGQSPKPAAAPAPVRGSAPAPAIRQILTSIRAADKGQLAVSEEDGRFLRTLVTATRAQHVLEIGSASGYSGIWIGLGLRETGGRLVTIEFDPVRAREATAHIKAAGLSDLVTVVSGDAFVEIPKLTGTFDMVFLDAWKPDYKRFFEIVFPRLTPGGLFLAHNVINKKNEMGDFLAAIESHPQAITSIVSAGHEGISMTVRRR